MPIMHDNEAMGAWIKAVMYLWANGPCEEERLGLAVGLGWVRVGFLFSEKNGVLQLDWMEEMRAERAAFRDKQRANGKKGGRPKAAPIKAENPGLSFGLTQTKAKESPRVEDEYRRLKTEDEDGRLKIEVEEEKKTREPKSAKPKPEPPTLPFASEKFAAAWSGYLAMRAKARKPPTDRAVELVLAKLAAMGEPAAIASLDASTVAGWTDVYPPKAGSQTIAEKSQSTIMSRTERPEPLRDFIRRRSAEATASRATETTEPNGA